VPPCVVVLPTPISSAWEEGFSSTNRTGARPSLHRIRPMIAPAVTEASPVEASRLQELEQVIQQGLVTFVEVGTALAEIRDSRLYRWTHDTFAEYCDQRWGMTTRRARQVMDAAVLSVSLMGTTVPPDITERTVRPLAALPEPERAAAVEEVRERVSHGEPPREAVQRAVSNAKRQPGPPPQEDDDAPDVLAELESADAEIRRLTALVESLSVSDQGREIASWSAKFSQLNARLQQAITTGNEAGRQAEGQGKLLKKIREALGVEKNADIVPAIHDLKR
jgi:hypothetical protein